MTATACPWHDKMLPQWCGDCGGFVGWHCAMCAESVVDDAVWPGHCQCEGGSPEWVDGPDPTVGQLLVGRDARKDHEVIKRVGAASVAGLLEGLKSVMVESVRAKRLQA